MTSRISLRPSRLRFQGLLASILIAGLLPACGSQPQNNGSHAQSTGSKANTPEHFVPGASSTADLGVQSGGSQGAGGDSLNFVGLVNGGLHATIKSIRQSGNWCSIPPEPGKHEQVAENVLQRAYSGIDSEEAIHGCRLTIEMEVPAGFSMSLPQFDFDYQADCADGSVENCSKTVPMTRTYRYFDSVSSVTYEGVDLRGRTWTDSSDKVWSQCITDASKPSVVTLIADFKVDLSARDLEFGIDLMRINPTIFGNVKFKRCDGEEHTSGKSGLEQRCGGFNNIQCEDGLFCELSDDPVSTGEIGLCKSLSSPKKIDRDQGEFCGGPLGHRCRINPEPDKRLVCWYPSEAPDRDKWVGTCQFERQEWSRECGAGAPKLDCKDGLVCVNVPGIDVKTCRSIEGEGSVCETHRDCDANSSCSANICTRMGDATLNQPCNNESNELKHHCKEWLDCVREDQGNPIGICKAEKRCDSDENCDFTAKRWSCIEEEDSIAFGWCGPKSGSSNNADQGCNATQFQCRSGLCIESDQLCDGRRDCPGGEDEKGCETPGCGLGEWECNSGECIYLSQVCDGHRDCSNGEDEKGADCKPKKKECASYEYKCDDGKCIDSSGICDGRRDCSGGEDENDCETPGCGLGEWECNSGECIYLSQVCDGRRDCSNGEDESGADCKPKKKECASDEYKCDDGKCIDSSGICDGRRDCSGGEDENDCETPGCGLGEWECHTGTCISMSQLCDGNMDCPTGEDEAEEEC